MRRFIKRFLPTLLCALLIAQGALAYTTLRPGDKGAEVLRMQLHRHMRRLLRHANVHRRL